MKKVHLLIVALIVCASMFAELPKHDYNIRIYMPEICDDFAVYRDSVCVMGEFDSWQGQLTTAQVDEQSNTYYSIQLTGVSEDSEFAIRLGKAQNNRQIMCAGSQVPNMTFSTDTNIVIQYRYGCYIYGCPMVEPYVKRTWSDVTDMIVGFYSGSKNKLHADGNARVRPDGISTSKFNKKTGLDSVMLSFDTINVFYTSGEKIHKLCFPYLGHEHAQEFIDTYYSQCYYWYPSELKPIEPIVDKLKGKYVSQTNDSLYIRQCEESTDWEIEQVYDDEFTTTLRSTLTGYFENKDDENQIYLIAHLSSFVVTMDNEGNVVSIAYGSNIYNPSLETALEDVKLLEDSACKFVRNGQLYIRRNEKLYNAMGRKVE